MTEYDLCPGVSSTLNELDYTVSQPISILNLIKFMLQESCNTSTDILLKLMKGPSTVMKYLEQIGIQDMRVDRTVLQALASWDGINNLPTDERLTLTQYKALENNVSQKDSLKAKETFRASMCDTTKPTAMAQLLVRLFKKGLLNEKHTELLLKIMRRCKRGPKRLMGLLPNKTPIAHKTGSLTGYTNDVGILTLPHGYGHVAIAAYIKESNKSLQNNERVLAEIGRTIYDFFLFNSLPA